MIKDTSTSVLFQRLKEADSFERYQTENGVLADSMPFHIYLSDLCLNKGMIPERVIKIALIDRTYGHQLFNGTRKPSRDKAIQLAFGFKLDADETQKLLEMAQKNKLHPKIKRDAAILYCLYHKISLIETQAMLSELGLTVLGGY
jgi:hypothetical protein